MNLEYETGEEASFVRDIPKFEASLGQLVKNMHMYICRMQVGNVHLANELAWRMRAVEEGMRGVMDVRMRENTAKVLYDIARCVAEDHEVHAEYERRELWYAAIKFARGLEDIHYTRTVIEPMIAHEEDRVRRVISDEERAEVIRRAIENYRGKKKYQYAELVKGAFPATQFEDHSFDRITASWSISTHMFSVVNEQQFSVLWKECNRLLTREGVAYIWPLNYGSHSKIDMARSLRAYRAGGGNIGLGIWNDDSMELVWIDTVNSNEQLIRLLEDAQTLVVLPVGARSHVQRRIEHAILVQQS